MVLNRHVTRLTQFLSSFRNLLIVSTFLRIGLILYSEWHDAHSVVKYTDVDYRVFSDAARFVLHPSPKNHAQGPLGEWLGIGDPYTRATYRYTPLLALLLTPNEWIHPSFGKYLFSGCDILAGVLMYKLLVSVILPSLTSPSSSPSASPTDDSKVPEEASFEPIAGETETPHSSSSPPPPTPSASVTTSAYASILTSLHLLNPLVFTISTRGSSESVLSLFVLLTLYCALQSRWNYAAVLLGLSTHWKIYPFIYGVGCLGVIAGEGDGGRRKGWKGYVGRLVSWRGVKFTVVSAGTFVLLGGVMYVVWGRPFLYESYIYHFDRRDHRHNFSPYFYVIYLTYPFPSDPILDLPLWRRIIRSPLTSFIPQMILSLGAGLLFGRRKKDLTFAWFVQTFTFVVFNRVCTSQYFLWYTLFVPLLVPQLSIPVRWVVAYVAVWFGVQALWLSEAYKLEFLGENVFLGLWVRSCIYVVGHCWVLAGIMDGYQG